MDYQYRSADVYKLIRGIEQEIGAFGGLFVALSSRALNFSRKYRFILSCSAGESQAAGNPSVSRNSAHAIYHQ